MSFFPMGRHLVNTSEVAFAQVTPERRFEVRLTNGTTVWVDIPSDMSADDYLSLACNVMNGAYELDRQPVDRRSPHQRRMAARRGQP